MSSRIPIIDQPPTGWFPIDVLKSGCSRKLDWSGLMTDVHPDDLKTCQCKIAFLYVHPDEYRPGERVAHEVWVRVPGKHRNKVAAWEAFLDLVETRH